SFFTTKDTKRHEGKQSLRETSCAFWLSPPVFLAYILKFGRTAGQPFNSLRDRWMRREQVADVHPQQWLNDKQVCRRGRRHHRHSLRVGVQFSQGARQRVRVPGEVCSRFVGLIFARSGDGQLDQHGCEWRQNHHGQRGKASAPSLFAITTSTEEHSEAGS